VDARIAQIAAAWAHAKMDLKRSPHLPMNALTARADAASAMVPSVARTHHGRCRRLTQRGYHLSGSLPIRRYSALNVAR
jgi:hypothetical protein